MEMSVLNELAAAALQNDQDTYADLPVDAQTNRRHMVENAMRFHQKHDPNLLSLWSDLTNDVDGDATDSAETSRPSRRTLA
jgi:hypothetical protein